MIAEYSRCTSGKRCIIKTDNSFFFRKFTLLVAIKNTKCIGWILYEKGGMTKERLVDFIKCFIFNKYKNHLMKKFNNMTNIGGGYTTPPHKGGV